MSAHLLLQTLVAWLLLIVGCVLVFELVRPLVVRLARRMALAGRLPSLVALCWSPVLVATLLAIGCYLPWLLSSTGFSHDHCEIHGGHVHLCVAHVHAAEVGLFSWVLFAVTATWVGAGLRELVLGLRRGLAFHRSLRALAPDDQATILDAEVPLSVTTGLWRPRIFVTSALFDVLSESQQRAVLEHERCHAREHHALTKLLAALGSIFLRRSSRRALLHEVALACERRADEAAAAKIGDRLEVATALLTTRRALLEHPPHGVLALHGTKGFEARIRVLSDGAETMSPLLVRVGLTMGTAVLALAIGYELHHGLETLLSHFLV